MDTSELSVRCELVNVTQVWDKEKIVSPNRNRTQDLLHTGWALNPLSYKDSRRARMISIVLILKVRRKLITYELS